MTPAERLIHHIAEQYGCRAEIVHTGDQMADNAHLACHTQTVHEREASTADSRFMTVKELQVAK